MTHRQPQRTGGGIRYSTPLSSLLGVLVLAVGVILVGDVRPAAAFHYVDEPGGYGCSNCHTLDAAEGDPDSSYINRSSRTFVAMKTANGGVVPLRFGCTYCHNNTGNATMRGVLNHFNGKTSMHPVGKNFVSGANNDNEYLSTWASSTNNELDCVDCHDISLGSGTIYPEHGTPPVANPFMLRNIAGVGEYDGLCRTCHGNAAALVKGSGPIDNNFRLTATSVHTDGDAGGSGPIAESDGTPLRPAVTAGNDQCRACHDTHYSSNYKLFNDGHEGAESNLDVATDCTSVCHYNGDESNNFELHGHGMDTSTANNPLNFNCTSCHTVTARHDSPFTDTRAAKMFAATPDPLFSSLTPTKSLTSICSTCHGTLKAHRGTVGCLDCHDEHAEGSGTTSNIYMIPQQLPNRNAGEPGGTEPTVFEHATSTPTVDFDYYIGDNTLPHIDEGGVCDNGICHAGLTAGASAVPLSPLSGLMTGNNHTGGNIATPLIDCGTCHKHNEASGSWGADYPCTSCHGQPPNSLATQYAAYADHFESMTPHARHANTAPVGYQFDCRMCHNNWTSAQTHNTTPETYESIWFDRAFNINAGAFPGDPPPYDTPDYDEATNTCSNIYCHSDGSSVNAVGTAVWMTGLTTPNYATINLPCNSCHNDGGANAYPADTAGNHARHVAKGVGCEHCHSTTTADGVNILVGNGQHVDREKDVVGGGTYNTQAVSFTWDGATKTCSVLSCHSGRQFAAASITWATASVGGWCTNCHNNGVNDGLLTNAWPVQGEHLLHAGALPTNYAYLCFRCHPDNSSTHSLLNKSVIVDFDLNFVAGGVYYPDGLDAVPLNGDDATCDATYCHGTGSLYVPDWDNGNQRLKSDGTVAIAADCNMCHGTAGEGAPGSETGRPSSPPAGGRHTSTTHATLLCTACHLNDNTDHTLHAKGPAQPLPVPGPVRADAAMAALIDSLPAIYSRDTAAALDQGFSYTNGTCADMTTGCHPSAQWGQSFGCALCHGDRTAVPMTYWPDGANTAGHYYDTDAGSHPEHIAALQAKEGFTLSQADQTAMCAYCHPNPGSATHGTDTVGSLPNRVDVINDGNAANAGAFSRIDPAADLAATADGHTAAAYAPATLTCSNADCHYEKPTPGYAGLGWDDGDAQAPDCETCHFTRGTVGLDTYPTRAYVVGTAPVFADGDLPDSHLAHVAGIASPDVNASKSYDCSFCHTVLPNTAHLNGSIDLSALGNPTIGKDGNSTDEIIAPTTTAVKYGVAANTTCTNMYCHGADFSGAADGTGGTRGTDITPVWNLQATGTCGTCHDIDTEAGNVFGQQLTQGAHGTHMAGKSGITWGPGLNSHANRCQVCHGWKDDGTTGTPVSCASNCHYATYEASPTSLPGSAADAGFVWEPSANHVNGTIDTDFQVDFEDQDRGWSDAMLDVYNSPTSSGFVAPIATTDICDNCHSTANVGGQFGATVAKANWLTAARITNCLLCHNDSDPAVSRAVIGGVAAPGKDAFYAASGHGNAGPFNATLHGQNGPGFACSVCHAENSAHISGALGEDRLDAANVDALPYTTVKSQFCLDCHGPSGAGLLGVDAVAEASVHSGGVTGRFAPAAIAGDAYGNSASLAANPGYQCDACHDPHGTGKLAMIRSAIDGNLGGVSNPVAITNFASAETDLTNLDPVFGTGVGQTGVCDACHTSGVGDPPHPDSTKFPGNHNQGGTGDACMVCHDHTRSFEGSCTRCHGNTVAGNAWPDGTAEHGSVYPNRPGDHQQHIDAIYAVNAASLPGATPTEKKNKTCDWCHPNAGANGHEIDTGGSLANTADVHGDPHNTGTSFKNIAGVANGVPTDVYNNTVAAGGKACSDVDCHYRATTPTWSATANGDGWYQPLAVATCANCHQSDTAYNSVGPGALPNAHRMHVDERTETGYDFPCTYCHTNHGANTSHQNGSVDFNFATALGEPGGTAASQAGSNQAVKFGGGAGYATCNNFYCHGDDLGAAGSDLSPVWNGSAACGTCHDTGNADTTPTVIATGQHTVHLTAANGPQFGSDNVFSCMDCHPAYIPSFGTHVNNQKDFTNIDGAPNQYSVLGATAPTVDPPTTSTDRCTHCHSTATVDLNAVGAVVGTLLAKANWSTGGYTLPCLTCHNGIDPATDNAAGTIGAGDPAAPDMLGNDSASLTTGYGAEVRGHNRTTSFQDAAGIVTNPAPNRVCDSCHDTAAGHFNDTDDTAFAQMRLLATINSQGTGSVTGVCNACHTAGIGSRATSLVSPHGNTAYLAKPLHDLSVAPFAYRCEACHEPHGLTNDAAVPTYANIYMVRPLVGVGSSFTTVPGGANATTIPVRFQRLIGTDSYDDGATQADNICVGCHLNGARPDPDAMVNSDGNHSELVGFTGNEQGKNCTSCHLHDYDNVQATVDGFMPLACDECHGNPPTTGAHTVHVAGMGYVCEDCHYGNDHNPGQLITTPVNFYTDYTRLQVEVGFNPAGFNSDANNGTTLGLPGTTRGAAIANATCTNLTCHNPDTWFTGKGVATSSNNVPVWGATIATCTACHVVSPASNPDGGRHSKHDNVATAGYAFACTICHSDVNVTGGATRASHANKILDTTAVVPIAGTLGGATIGGTYNETTCANVYCHAPVVDANAANQTPTWAAGTAACGSCHGADNGTVTTWPATNAHPKHAGDGAAQRNLACTDCHANFATQHVDGYSQVAFSAAIQTWGTLLETYGGTTTVGDNVVDTLDTCANLYCHSDVTSPSVGYLPVQWNAGALACGSCHAAGGASAPHAAHTSAPNAGKGYACSVCHSGAGDDTLSHADHLVQNTFSGSWNGVDLGNGGTYDYSGTETPFDAVGNCNSLYCHGDFTGGTTTNAQNWSGTAACGTCHNASWSSYGAHILHSNMVGVEQGPRLGGCLPCHTAFIGFSATDHVNGTKSFNTRTISTAPGQNLAETDLAGTGACDACHGNATEQTSGPKYDQIVYVKSRWPTPTASDYTDVTCESCHGQFDPAHSTEDGTSGVNAPVMTTYYATVNGGHGDATAPKRAQTCDDCHYRGIRHFNAGTEDRINEANITTFCQYCHDGNATDDSAATSGYMNEIDSTRASVHSNVGAGYTPPNPPKENAFTEQCLTCHNPHGSANITMVNTTINAAAVTYTADTQWDTAAGANDVCEVCHTVDTSPANLGAVEHLGGLYTANGGQHQADYRDSNACIGCHTHEYDNNVATADGFMPLACNACHTYPGLPTAGAEHPLSPIHNIHVDPQASGGYTFACTACHFGYPPTHNQSGFVDGGSWTDVTVPPANIHIRFDTALNPTNQTSFPRYNNVNATTAATTGIAAHNGTCAGLSCHGNNQTTQLDWTGSAEQPAWHPLNNPPRLACGSCHADPPASGAHTLHADTNDEGDRTDCEICHSAVAGYGASGNTTTDPVNHVNGSTTISFATYGDATLLDGYCTGACHNSTPFAERWNEPSLACSACHYYNTAGNPSPLSNTAGSTFRPISELSHDGHFASPGRVWSCNDCHPNNAGDTSPLTHVTSGSGTDALYYQGRAIPTQSEATISTTQAPQWWNAPADWTGTGTKTCANRCHNPSAGVVKASTAWGTTSVGCEYCHNTASAPATGSHEAHLATATTYGLTLVCDDCHPINVSDGHMTGLAEIVRIQGVTPYSGALTPPWATSYGTCTTVTCHNTGDGVTPRTTSIWGTPIVDPNCGICHDTPPATGRHVAHDNNNAWVPNDCGSCHAAPNNKTSMATYATHIDGTIDINGTASVVFTTPDCTNDCHLVGVAVPPVSSNPGDWLDANPLACTDCHSGAYIGTPPTSGLHAATTAMAHDDEFMATAGEFPETATCTNCHTAAGPSATHLTGSAGTTPPTEDSTETAYSFVAANVFSYSQANGCQATCHSDYKLADTSGLWRRKWLNVTDDRPDAANNPGDPVCDNCHGDFSNGWRWSEASASTTDHSDPSALNSGDAMGVHPNHIDCQTCHGWGHAAYDKGWGGTSPGHGDGSIAMNGPEPTTGAGYINAGTNAGGCAKACHSPTWVMNTISGWDVNYGDFGGGACEGCHNGVTPGRNGLGDWAPNVMGDGNDPDGTGTTAKPYDNGVFGYNVNGHGANGTADSTPSEEISPGVFVPYLTPDRACTDCHSLQSHHFDGVLDSVSTGSKQVNTYHLRTDGTYPFIAASPVNAYDVQSSFDLACYMRCHQPGSVTNMRHAKDLVPAWNNVNTVLNVVRFGDKSTITNVSGLGYPVDHDITTKASTGGDTFAPCSSCHNAHGTAVIETQKNTNRMVRDNFFDAPTLCLKCH